MLRSAAIPQYDDPWGPENWKRFLEKAGKGSIKAPETLERAHMAYMAALAKVPSAPDTLDLEEYSRLFCSAFPKHPPVQSVTGLFQIAYANQWIAEPLHAFSVPCHPLDYYSGLWKRSVTVDWKELVHDAMHCCLSTWSAPHCQACINDQDLDFNSRDVVVGMVYLSLTWPEN